MNHPDRHVSDCIMCSKPHDASFSKHFCGRSCQLVYAWRRRMGYWVAQPHGGH